MHAEQVARPIDDHVRDVLVGTAVGRRRAETLEPQPAPAELKIANRSIMVFRGALLGETPQIPGQTRAKR